MTIRMNHNNEQLILQKNQYAHNDALYLDLFSPSEGPYATLSVNLDGVSNQLPPQHFVMPTYNLSENLRESIHASGLFEFKEPIRIGYGEGFIVELKADLNAIDEA